MPKNSFKVPGLDSYFGGKAASGTYQKIINQIRPHSTLVIPYMGNCAITRHIKLPQQVLGNDLDGAVVAAWQQVQNPRIRVEQGEALDFIASTVHRVEKPVIYCDPPYPLEARKSQRLVYAHEMTSLQHCQLLEAVRWLRVDCLVSTYPNKLYADALSHWRRIEFTSPTRKGPATEWLFMNYDAPQVLHDDSYAGSNYREREYIKRKAGRWLSKYAQLGKAEQQVILADLLATTSDELLRELLQHRQL